MKDEQPFFSIIIPTYDRPSQLSDCLNSIAEIHYPRDCLEVIVVDDGGSISPESAVALMQARLDVTLLVQRNAGPAAARNTGAAKAKGRFLAFTDDDCMPDPDWLRVFASCFKETPNRLLGGQTINLLSDNIYSTASQVIVDAVYRHYNASPDQPRFFASNNMALPADLFFEAGGFNPDFTTSEDREFCDRCLHRGFQMTYVPEAVIRHAHRLKFYTFCRQHFNYGRGAFRFHLIRARRGSNDYLQDFKFHLNLRNWLLRPFSNVKTGEKTFLTVLLAAWQVVNAAGFFWEAWSYNIKKLNQGKIDHRHG